MADERDWKHFAKMANEAQKPALQQADVMCCFLFQYRSMDKDLMVRIEASSLNDAMVKFATHYHLIDEVYEIARVS
jgi:hypothetical protein